MLCRFWCLHIVCSVHTQFPHDIQNRETSNTSDAANSTRRFFSGSSKFRKSSWKTTNHQNLHQWHQQYANFIQCCVGFDVCTLFVVCTHSFHTTSKREKPQTHRMGNLYTSLFFWFIKFRKSSWKTTNNQNLHQWHQKYANFIQCCVGFDLCLSFVVCLHSFHTTSKTEKANRSDVAKRYTSLFLVHQISGKAVGKRQINEIYTNDPNSTLALYNVA